MISIPLNNKPGIRKPRCLARCDSNLTVSSKQAFKNEIAHWQELVVLSQEKQCERIRGYEEGKNGDIKYFDNTLENGSIETKINSKFIHKLNNKTDESIKQNSNFKIHGKIRGIHIEKALQGSITLNEKQNGIRHDSTKSPIKRANFRKIVNRSHLTQRRKDKGEPKEPAFATHVSKPALVTRKISPTMRNL